MKIFLRSKTGQLCIIITHLIIDDFNNIRRRDDSDNLSVAAQNRNGILRVILQIFDHISGLDDNEKVSLYTIDGRCIGTATAFGGVVSFSAQANSIVVAKIGKESVKIAVE